MTRPLQLKLNRTQRRALERFRKKTKDVGAHKRATVILMSAAGHSTVEIARALGFTPEGVSAIRKRWLARGMEMLPTPRSPGRPPRVTPQYLQLLREVVEQNPIALGYGFSVWSAARLAAHLGQRTGIWLTERWVRELLAREGYVFRRPKHTLRGKRDEGAYQRAKRRLSRLKKGRLPATMT